MSTKHALPPFICLLILVSNTSSLIAQKKTDSTKTSVTKKALLAGMKLVSTNPSDTIVNVESIDNYTPYTGKTIRYIYVERIGFEKSIYDSAKKVTKTITKLANALHSDTREKTIRDHIFFQPYQPLNPYELADNERFIRDKDFILDCRIVATPVEGTDSVDVTVITRDVFSLGATFGGTFPTSPEIGIYDANINGGGQRLQFTALLDQDRDPKFGYSLFYRKSSLLGSLTNIDLGYTQLNTGLSVGDETEFAYLARITRPLVSPYLRMAGGLEVSATGRTTSTVSRTVLSLIMNIKSLTAGWAITWGSIKQLQIVTVTFLPSVILMVTMLMNPSWKKPRKKPGITVRTDTFPSLRFTGKIFIRLATCLVLAERKMCPSTRTSL